VRVDRFALFNCASHLSANQLWLLTVLILLADWRTQEYRGTLTELSTTARMSRNTVKPSITALASAGHIVELDPFGGNRVGRVWVHSYDELVIPNRPGGHKIDLPAGHRLAQNCASPGEESAYDARDIARDARSKRAEARESVGPDLDVRNARSSDREEIEKGVLANNKRTGSHAGERLSRRAPSESCSNCGEPADGDRLPSGLPACKQCEAF
jgi:hypothetical protein